MEKQPLIECPNCHRLIPPTMQHKHLDVGIPDAIEMGISCQHCQRWAHFGYYNPLLIERQKHLTNRRKERAFKRDFLAFQVEIEKALEESTENEPA